MNFYACIHPCNHYSDQDMEYFSTQKTSLGPLWVRNYSQESYSDLYHICLLVLPVFMLHINGLIWYVLFCPWQFSLNIMSMRIISVVEYISEVNWTEVAQSCLTLCDPVDCSLPGSSVHGILQARILEWVAISFSWDLPDPGIEPGSPTLRADALWSEPQGSPVYWYTEYISSPFFLKIVCYFIAWIYHNLFSHLVIGR